jgi:hypothetical protein
MNHDNLAQLGGNEELMGAEIIVDYIREKVKNVQLSLYVNTTESERVQ